MPNARERLIQLLDLAGHDTPEHRRRLVDELCELLLDWPDAYPLSMRAHFDKLLEKAAQDVDAETRAMLATRFAALPGAPVGLLNELFFDAPAEVKPAILRRNALAHDLPADRAADGTPADGDHSVHEAALVAAARSHGGEDLTREFARLLGVDGAMARRILDEPTGEALAAACKGAHLKRATFSTLALLFAPGTPEGEARLDAYDAVPQDGAENLIRFWRAHPVADESETRAA